MMAFYDHNLVYWKPIVALHRRHRAPKPYTTLETTMTVTAYIPVDYAVGQTGVTASGAPATPMVTAAAPAWVPFGTRIWIAPLHQWFTVQDRGGAIHGHRLDLCMASLSQALQWGVHSLTVKLRIPRSAT